MTLPVALLGGADHVAAPVRLPSLIALGVQVGAAITAALAAYAWHGLDMPSMPLMGWALLQGVCAALLALRLRMAHWWLFIHLGFVPLAALAYSLQLPPVLFLGLFALLLLVHGATFRTQVPTHLSRHAAIARAAALFPRHQGFRCLDLGCGTGSVLAEWCGMRPDGRYAGIEGAVLPFLISWLRGRRHGFAVQFGNLWHADLANYDVVYAFLSPACMPRLWEKALQEMRPGTLLISNEFSIPGVVPDVCIPLPGRRDASLHAWRIPAC